MAELCELCCLCLECMQFAEMNDNVKCNCCEGCEKAMTRRRCWCRNESLYPVMSLKNAGICKSLNWCPLTAGWGTILSSCLAYSARPLDRIKMVLVGILYWILMPVLCLGWCYSAKHGKRLKKKAKEYDEMIRRAAEEVRS